MKSLVSLLFKEDEHAIRMISIAFVNVVVNLIQNQVSSYTSLWATFFFIFFYFFSFYELKTLFKTLGYKGFNFGRLLLTFCMISFLIDNLPSGNGLNTDLSWLQAFLELVYFSVFYFYGRKTEGEI